MRTTVIAAVAVLSVLASAAQAVPTYVTSTWSDGRIEILDENFGVVSSFAAGADKPNGVAATSSLIFSGHFTTEQVFAYDYSGVVQYSFSSPNFGGLQGLTVVGNEIAAWRAGGVDFYTLAGAFTRSISSTGNVEGLAFDGSLLWEISSSLRGRDPITGAILRDIPNAAVGCGFEGTGIADGGTDALALACNDGSWFVVSDTTGAVLNSGNNGLDMFGLDNIVASTSVPEPGTLALIGTGLLGYALQRRRRTKVGA